jgi:hypothetical protein
MKLIKETIDLTGNNRLRIDPSKPLLPSIRGAWIDMLAFVCTYVTM